jgi:hypothetical protein
VRREWEPEDLIACWTLVDGDAGLVGNKSGPTRLGFVLMLRFFELEGRFPRHAGELPEAAVKYMAQQVKVDAANLASYDWSGRTIKYHRAQIREAYMEELVERLVRWDVHPELTVTDSFPLTQAAEAYRVADDGRRGKVGLVMAP